LATKNMAIKNMVTKTYGEQKCDEENLWWPKTWRLKPMAIETYGDRKPNDQKPSDRNLWRPKLLAIKFLWWLKDVSIITKFTTIKMILVLISCMPTPGSPKWLLT
jgi:hypothetical protein